MIAPVEPDQVQDIRQLAEHVNRIIAAVNGMSAHLPIAVNVGTSDAYIAGLVRMRMLGLRRRRPHPMGWIFGDDAGHEMLLCRNGHTEPCRGACS